MTETKNLKLKTYETTTDGQELVARYIDNTSDNFQKIDEFCKTDTTLSVEGGIADAKTVGDNVSQLKDDIDNYAISPNMLGTEANTLYRCFIPNGTKVTISTSDGSIITNNIVFNLYKKDKTKADSWSLSKISERTITTNADIYFVEITELWTSPIQIEIGEKATPYKAYFMNAKVLNDVIDEMNITTNKNFENVNNRIYEINSFIYSYKAILNNNGGYLSYEDGTILPSNYGKYTDEISLGLYDTIEYTCGIGDGTVAFICFYDENHAYLKDISVQASSINSGVIDISTNQYANAKYVRFSYYDYRDDADYSLFNGLLTKKDSLDSRIKKEKYKIFGKNVLIFGDSITDCCPQENNSSYQTTSYYFREPSNYYTNAEGKTVNYDMWPKLFKDICEPKEVRNYAKSGATYKYQDETRLSLSNQIRIALNDLNNPNAVFSQNTFVPDVVIFALGTNDGANPNDTYESAMNKTVLKADGYTVDVEATLSNLDLSKFNESVRYAFLTIKNRFPMAQVFVSLPIQRNYWEMHESNLVKSLEKMAKRYGCIVIDATAESGIISDTNTYNDLGVLLKDGLHPNEYGSNLLARMFITSVASHYMPMDAMNN